MEKNKLILIGNGFDLAHGLKTSYLDFIDWYVCNLYNEFCANKNYNDCLIGIENKFANQPHLPNKTPNTFKDVLNFDKVDNELKITYHSNFFRRLLDSFELHNWVDIERFYYRLMKSYFTNPNVSDKDKAVLKLNSEFDFIIEKLTSYIKTINQSLNSIAKLKCNPSPNNFSKIFENPRSHSSIQFLNFNYTDTLHEKGYARIEDIIYMHGRVADLKKNPIIFGYGDESDPSYQSIEDSGENFYLEHIKSFGYFSTGNYHRLLTYIDSDPFTVSIVGHSCGLSDRVLLNQILEHKNCQRIEIYYHVRKNGTDNFKEITQEISRHFKPQHKDIMRRKVSEKNPLNLIPQNI